MGGSASVVEKQAPVTTSQLQQAKSESKKIAQAAKPNASTVMTQAPVAVAPSEPKLSIDNSTISGTQAAEAQLSNAKLKKYALGIQGYKEQQRDYDSTMSQLELNRSSHVEWTDPKQTLKPHSSFYQDSKQTTPQSRAKHFDFSPGHISKYSTEGSSEDVTKKKSITPSVISRAVGEGGGGGDLGRSTENGSSFGKFPQRVQPSPKHGQTNQPPKLFPRKDQHIDVEENSLMADFSTGETPSRSTRPQNVPDLRGQFGAVQALQGPSIKKPMNPPQPMGLGGPPPPMMGPPPGMTGPPPMSGPPPMMSGPPPMMTGPPPMVGPPPGVGMMPLGMNIPPPNVALGMPPGSNKVIFVPMPVNPLTMTPPPGSALLPPSTGSSNRPISTAPLPTVIETTDVKRNRAQLPKNTEHAKPTTGDWLEKRYIVNDFILLYTLGTGSYGEVRLCKNRKTDKLYAIKIISKDFLKKRKSGKTDETYFEDIKREIAIMKKLSHPNILRLFEVLDDPKVNKMYLVLEYMKMGDLVNILKKQEGVEEGAPAPSNKDKDGFTPLLDPDLWHIFKQLVAGINYLHEQNIVHGDIKPQNLLLGEDGILKIADFGISQMLSGEGDKLADAGGTPAFMAPELCEQRSSFSGQKADIWAIGATIFMLKFGHPPFVAKSIINLYHKICNDLLIFPGPIEPSLKNLLEGILEKDPDRRMTIQVIMTHPWYQIKPAVSGTVINIPLAPGGIPPPRIVNGLPTKLLPFPNLDIDSHKNGISGIAGLMANSVADTANNAPSLSQQATAMMTFSFQPPASYEAQLEAAMKAPKHTVNKADIFMSIGGIKALSDHDILKNNESKKSAAGINEDDNEEEMEESTAKKHTGGVNKAEETDGNLLQTNWGADVFQIVDDDDDDEDDDDEVDDIDLDSDDDENENVDKVLDFQATGTSITSKSKKLGGKKKSVKTNQSSPLSVNSVSSDDDTNSTGGGGRSHAQMIRKESHSQMSSEEEERRSKQFIKKVITKKQSSENMTPKVTNMMSEVSGLTISPSARTRRSSKLSSPFLDSPGNLNASFLSQNDLLDEGEVMENLTNDELQEIMDTLSQQPSTHSHHHHSSHGSSGSAPIEETVFEDSNMDVSFDNISVKFKNTRNGIGGALFSEKGRRGSQEDRILFIPNAAASQHHTITGYNAKDVFKDHLQMFSIACVFDGHNGLKSSQYLSQHFTNALLHHEAFLDAKRLESVIYETCLYLDTQLCAQLVEEEDVSGSTGVIAIYDGRKQILTVAGVGDSLCILSRNGRAIAMNRMHRMDNTSEKERVKSVGGTIVNNRVNGVLAVSRAFGDIQFKSFQPDQLPFPSHKVPPGMSSFHTNHKLPDKLVLTKCLVTAEPEIHAELITPKTEFAILATDGLWDVMSPQVAVSFVRSKLLVSKDLQKVTQELTNEALIRGSVDNVSCIILSFHTQFAN